MCRGCRGVGEDKFRGLLPWAWSALRGRNLSRLRCKLYFQARKVIEHHSLWVFWPIIYGLGLLYFAGGVSALAGREGPMRWLLILFMGPRAIPSWGAGENAVDKAKGPKLSDHALARAASSL